MQRYATGVNARINFLIKIDFVVREETGGMRWGKKKHLDASGRENETETRPRRICTERRKV